MLISSIGTGWSQTLAAIDFDISAPIISHEPLRQGAAGQMLTITAAIEDNVAVKSAAVVFLTSTGQQYQQVAMYPDNAASVWLTTIDTTVDDTVVNYYIIAEDSEGNRIQKGGQSNPFVVELWDGELSLNSASESKESNMADNKSNLLLIMAGVLLAGILLSGSGSGDGADSSAIQSDDTCCTVTFTVDSTGGN